MIASETAIIANVYDLVRGADKPAAMPPRQGSVHSPRRQTITCVTLLPAHAVKASAVIPPCKPTHMVSGRTEAGRSTSLEVTTASKSCNCLLRRPR
jgi:hypothetical protein